MDRYEPEDLEVLEKKVILTAREATGLGFFVSHMAAATMRKRKKGPPFVQEYPGAPVYYRREDLDAWMAKSVQSRRYW